MPSTHRLFRLGQVVATPGALGAMTRSDESPGVFLRRHQTGDWGELCDEDKKLIMGEALSAWWGWDRAS